MATFEYHNSSSDASLIIRHIINTNPNVFPSSLVIQFCLQTIEQYWSKDSKTHHEETQTKSLSFELHPMIYTSFQDDLFFYSVVREKLVNLGEEFDRNYRHVVIRDTIDRIREVIENEDSQNLKVFVGVIIVVDRTIEDESSIMQLVKKMEVDEDVVKNDCVICLENLGMERELLCMPCSHMFHGNCITKWLENGNSCPICRYDLLAS